MAKKEMTWMDVIREQLAKLRKEGKKPSIGDVTPQAKKEWEQIKAGKHPLYIQGSSKGMKRGKGNKTQKLGKKGSAKTQKMLPTGSANPNAIIQQMLSKVHLCKKDVAKIQKYLKTQKGGNCGCDKPQFGGKKNKTKKNKKMRGGDRGDGDDEAEQKSEDTKESFVQIDSEQGLLDNPEDTDGKEEVVVADEE